MGRNRHLMQRLADTADLGTEPLPGVPVIEVAGEQRVLIEGHGGVTQYSRERICVRVNYGQVAVCGRGLDLARMSREQLVISGCIDCVELLRRRG